jgi:hypothetical protein
VELPNAQTRPLGSIVTPRAYACVSISAIPSPENAASGSPSYSPFRPVGQLRLLGPRADRRAAIAGPAISDRRIEIATAAVAGEATPHRADRDHQARKTHRFQRSARWMWEIKGS